MIYRIAVGFIWLFWIVMVTLLIRSEYFPEHASLYRLPVSYVGKKIFTSDTGSDMTIYYKQNVVGRIMIEPSPPNERILKGNLKLDWPVLGQQYEGEAYFTFLFNPALEVDQFSIASKSDNSSLIVDGSRLEDNINAHFRVNDVKLDRRYKWAELEKQSYEGMMAGLNQQLGIQQLPPALLAGKVRKITWYAASGNLTRRGDKIDALLIATEGDRDYWVKVWVTPSGEILMVETSPAIGITLENKALMDIPS
jgi:hypothetical protein